MNKQRIIICLLCAMVMMTGIFTSCTINYNGQEDITSSNEIISTKEQNTQNAQAGTYWRTAGFDGVEIITGEYWAELFLWEDGTGYFRFSQATPASNYYGIYDVTDCNWSLEENGVLTLFESGTKTILYTGSVQDNVLTVSYDGYADEVIAMEKAEMPPYGSHWTIMGLYGIWKMTCYTDIASGYNAVSNIEDGFFAAEITLDRVLGIHFWLADPVNNNLIQESGMEIGYRLSANDDDDYTWYPYIEGPISENCVNQAWHAELTCVSEPNVCYFVTYEDNKLVLKKENTDNPDNYPSSFTAEFEYLGHPLALGEGDAFTILQNRYAEKAYAVILDKYSQYLPNDQEADITADILSSYLKDAAHIEDEQQLRELYYSIEEPLRSNSGFGYALRDINADGTPELFILSKDNGSENSVINALYTIQSGKTLLVDAYWSRNICELSENGTIYINGSSGADDSGYASFLLNSETGELELIETFDSSYSPDIAYDESGLIFIPFNN